MLTDDKRQGDPIPRPLCHRYEVSPVSSAPCQQHTRMINYALPVRLLGVPVQAGLWLLEALATLQVQLVNRAEDQAEVFALVFQVLVPHEPRNAMDRV
jgi:hypothetical protein